MTDKIKILYIMGRGRSGSTFVENDLAHRSGWPLLGESRLWPLVYRDNHNCSCGKPKTACPFWATAIDSLPNPDATKAAFRRMCRRGFLISLLAPNALARRIYADDITAVTNFYGHLAQTHDIDTLIDSSKNPAFGRVLALSDALDVQFVHVVRNPLGVAYSWKRQRNSGSEHGLHKQRKSIAMAALEWTGSNLLSSISKWRSTGDHVTLRYEDLGDPAVLADLTPSGQIPVDTATQHAMSGNPSAASRHREFRLDEGWRDGLTSFEKALCLIISGPVYLFYRGKG